MISSPCLNCNRKDEPKDECVKDCNTLHEIQEYQASLEEVNILSAINYGEETRFSINIVETERSDKAAWN